jgi:hypothetical protein
VQQHYFRVLENYHREQKGMKSLPVPEEGPEFDALWEHYLEARRKNEPQMSRENGGCWHRMRWERYSIPQYIRRAPPLLGASGHH